MTARFSQDELDPGDGPLDGLQLDRLRRLAVASGDPAYLGGIVNQYLDQAASQLAQLRAAAARRDAPALKAVAHSLRGTSATVGARQVASACGAVEEGAARGDGAQAEAVEGVARELERATVALRSAAEPLAEPP